MNTITITGKDFLDQQVRADALSKINTLTTAELEKLKEMCSPKGRKTLQSKWGLIKKFI